MMSPQEMNISLAEWYKNDPFPEKDRKKFKTKHFLDYPTLGSKMIDSRSMRVEKK